jgi:hypothetical protein
MSSVIRLRNPINNKMIELDQRFSITSTILTFRYWFVQALFNGRPFLGIAGISCIIFAIGSAADAIPLYFGGIAALFYIIMGLYFSVKRTRLILAYYVKNGWVIEH